MNYNIRLETKKDFREVENVTREAFWNVYRPGCVEHYVLHKYRDRADFVPQLDYVIETDGRIIGHIMYAKSEIELENGKKLQIMTFGPFSVIPEYKHKGYGSILLRYTMQKAREMGVGALAITGSFDLYGRFGFVRGKDIGVRYAFDSDADYFLVKELEDGFLDGVKGTYKDPDGYFVSDEEAEEFDKTFPHKEKIKTDSQIF